MTTVRMLRNSEIQTWKTCRHRWAWTYRDGRQSREAPTALRFGDLVHQALAAYYIPGRKRGPHPAETFASLYAEQAIVMQEVHGFNVFSDEKWEPAYDLGVAMLEGYVKRYADADQEYEVVASEQTFQLRLPGKRLKVVGTFDGLWRHLSTGSLIFKEFKTAAAISFDGLPMDEQAGMYWTYGPTWLRLRGLLAEDESIRHILYTFLRKARPNPDKKHDAQGRVLNQDGSVSKQQPAPYFERLPVYRDDVDKQRLHARVLDVARELRDARAGEYPIYKSPGPLHHPNCRGCPVREACELHETGGDFEPMLAATMVPWNPYEAHELPERF